MIEIIISKKNEKNGMYANVSFGNVAGEIPQTGLATNVQSGSQGKPEVTKATKVPGNEE